MASDTNGYPDPSEFLTAVQKRLGRVLFKDSRRFHIPLNQRPWSWKNANTLHLLNDFYKVLTERFDPQSSPKWKRKPLVKRPPHFFGTFVFYENDEDNLEVFDGQQRLTAICMLAAALRELAHAAKSEAGPHQKEADGLYGVFNGWLSLKPTFTDPRLVPNEFFADLFNALLFDPVDEKERAEQYDKLSSELKAHKVSKSVKTTFEQIRTWVFDEAEGLSAQDKTSFLAASYDVLDSLFACIETIIVGEEPYAYEVFECLNARGVGLTQADKIKNALFVSSPKSQHSKISTKWQQIGENVPNNDIGEFLRRRHISTIGACKKNDVFTQVAEKEIDAGKKTVDVITEWHADSEMVRQLNKRDAAFDQETRDRLEVVFAVLDVSLAHIPLLAAYKRFFPAKKADFLQCIRAVEKYVFRRLTVEGVDTPELERKLGEAARQLGGGATVKEFRQFLSDQSPDESFESKFQTLAPRRAKVQFYILRELETHLLGGDSGLVPGDHNQARNNIEHIMPRNPSKAAGRTHEWKWFRDNPQRARSLVNRLGNLMILESDINKQVDSHEYAVKRHGKFKKKNGKAKQYKCYKDSELVWPKRLCKAAWSVWTEKQIVKRQKQMTKDALVVWKI